MNKPVKYSIIISIPGAPDVDKTGYEQLHMTIAVRDLKSLYNFTIPVLKSPGTNDDVMNGDTALFPDHVIKYFEGVEEMGNYRAEIIEDVISYKLYIKPDGE